MLTQVRLKNFRVFEDSGQLLLPGLTLLLGPNSSGKSSVLHALLLLRQSIIERPPTSRVPQLVLDGSSIRLGLYRDVVHQHDEARSISFTFTVAPDVHPRHRNGEPLVDTPGAREAEWFDYYYARRSVQRTTTLCLTFSPSEPFGPMLSRVDIAVEGLGSMSIVRTAGGQRTSHWRTYPHKPLPAQSILTLFFRKGLFPRLHTGGPGYRGLAPGEKTRVRKFLLNATTAMNEVHQDLVQMTHIGPFRTPPLRHYAFSGFQATEVGSSGERAIDLLFMESVLNPSGPHSLRLALGTWLNRMGLATALDLDMLLKDARMFSVQMDNAGYPVAANIADVGFGVSQVLPVVVQGLLTPVGGTFLVQQPELHLHPDAQAALADFFLYLVSKGVNVVAETHSEYLLLRLRRRLAELPEPRPRIRAKRSDEPRELTRDDVAVLHLDATEKTRSIRRLEIGPGFQLENLPPRFMGDALGDRLAILQASSDKVRRRP